MSIVSLKGKTIVFPALVDANNGVSCIYSPLLYRCLDRLESGRTPSRTITAEDEMSRIEAKISAQVTKIEAQTRRKRSARQTNPSTVSNRFGPVAPSWFYSLVGNFMQRRDHAHLWAGSTGSRFLANLFLALATIVESSGSSPGTHVLAKDLFELVWTFRTVEVAEIRLSVLCACATSIALMPEEMVLSMLLDGSGDGLAQVLGSMAKDDPDKNCRNLASSLKHSVANIVDSVYGHGMIDWKS
jgi:hypothetical protein